QENPTSKRQKTFNILTSIKDCDHAFSYSPSSLLDEKTLSEVELLAGKKNITSYVAEKLDRTTTEIGKCTLFSLLATPTDDVNVLTARQKLIYHLADSPALLEQLHDSLNCFKDCENLLVSFFGKDGLKHTTERLVFPIEKFNEHNLPLESKN